MTKKKDILNKKEIEAKKRLYKIGSIASHNQNFFDLFKDDVLSAFKMNEFTFRNEMMEEFGGLGNFILAGRSPIGQLIDNQFSDVLIKWILTGNKICFNYLRDWYVYNLEKDYEKLSKERKEFKKEREIKSRFIYIVKSDKYYKIGLAKNTNNRLQSFQTSTPKKVKLIFEKEVEDYVRVEKDLHKKFKKKRIRGEWFKLSKTDLDSAIKFLNNLLTK